jgi:tetratricopeptide (TPR) repeat protein
MPGQTLFVGREQELAELESAIERPDGQVLVVVGGLGFGKTALLEEFSRRLATGRNGGACFSLLYRLNRNDNSDAFLSRLMTDLLNIRGLTRHRLVLGAPGRRDQVEALLKRTPAVGELLATLVPEDRRPVRERFLDFFVAAAARLDDHERLVLIFDPDEYLADSVATDWASMVGDLPPRTTVIFAQRPDDCVASSDSLLRAPNVHAVPAAALSHFSRVESDALIQAKWRTMQGWGALANDVPAALLGTLWEKYQGYVMPLTMTLEALPGEPADISELLGLAHEMPRSFRQLLTRRYREAVEGRPNAIRLLVNLAILDRPASADRLAAMSRDEHVTAADMAAVCADPSVARCLRQDGGGLVALFHDVFADVVLGATDEGTRRAAHAGAGRLYEGDLEDDRFDIEALDRLPFHLHESGNTDAFLHCTAAVFAAKNHLGLLSSLRRDLEQAVALLRPRAAQGRAPYAAALADTLLRLGDVMRQTGLWSEARMSCAESVELFRQLPVAERDGYRGIMASALQQLGLVLVQVGEFNEGRSRHEEAVEIFRALVSSDPERYRAGLAGALNDLGISLWEMGERQSARRSFEEATATYREVSERESQPSEAGLALSLTNLAAVAKRTGDRSLAVASLEEALDLRRRLAAQAPRAYTHEVATTLINLGNVLCMMGDHSASRKALTEAADMLRVQAAANPRRDLPGLAATLSALGAGLRETGAQVEARAVQEEAVAIYRVLSEREHRASARGLAAALRELAMILADAGELPASACAYEEALTVLLDVAQVQPDAYVEDLARTWARAFLLSEEMGDASPLRSLLDAAGRIVGRNIDTLLKFMALEKGEELSHAEHHATAVFEEADRE